jgi:hypothetical protein
VNGDSIVLVADLCCGRDTIAASEIAVLEVSRGSTTSPSAVVGGAVIGAGAGVAVGYIVTRIGCRVGDSENCGIGAIRYVPLFGVLGLLVGGTIGAKAKTERWERVAFRRIGALDVVPTGTGFALAFQLPWPRAAGYSTP